MTFISSEVLQKAYLGKHANELVVKTSEQVAVIYRMRGMIFPVIVSSTLQFLGQNSGASLAEIARALDVPHQLVAQRIQKLSVLGLVEKRPDPIDRRRSEYHLTEHGVDQAARLKRCMEDTALIYGDLYDEIGVDLPRALLAAIDAIESNSLFERFSEKFPQAEAI